MMPQLQMLANLLTMGNVNKQLADGNVWRPMSDIRMWYPVVVVDFVNAWVLWVATKTLIIPALGGVPNQEQCVLIGVVLALLTSVHGTWINYMSLKVGLLVSIALAAQCLGATALQGYLLSRWL